MSLSRRHFNALAEIVSQVPRQGCGPVWLAERLADLCARENGRFDRERFMTVALGTDGCGNYGRTDGGEQ